MNQFKKMKASRNALFAATLILMATHTVRAGPVYIPNADFGLPVVTDFDTDVATNMISWEASPQQNDGAIGVFLNAPDDGLFIVNCDGPQAAYIFEDPGVALFQDYDAVDSTGAPSHAFSATYEVGKSYQLQAGFIGSSYYYPLTPGATLQMSFYYRDSLGNMETIAYTNIVYDPDLFTGNTNFVDYELDSATVKASDPWAGQHIGIQFLPIFPDDVEGGFWDVGNVQLSEVLTPTLVNPSFINGQFGATLQSDPGLVFQILATTNLSVPVSSWTSVVTLTNVSGMASFVDTPASTCARFYQAQQLPSP
jgi:hypothetical protein